MVTCISEIWMFSNLGSPERVLLRDLHLLLTPNDVLYTNWTYSVTRIWPSVPHLHAQCWRHSLLRMRDYPPLPGPNKHGYQGSERSRSGDLIGAAHDFIWGAGKVICKSHICTSGSGSVCALCILDGYCDWMVWRVNMYREILTQCLLKSVYTRWFRAL